MICWVVHRLLIDFLSWWLIQFYQFISRFCFHSSSWVSIRLTLSNYLALSFSITPFLLHYSLYIYIYIHHLESFHFQINNNNNNSNQLQHQYHQYHQFIFVIITIINIKRLLIQSGINWNNEWKKRRRIKSEVSEYA